MTTTIIIVRHCEAEGNIKRYFQGNTDGAVSERGVAQLKLLSKRAEKIHFDAVYSSPLTRAIATAQAVKGSRDLPVIIDKRLIEINGGQLEGLQWADFPKKFPNKLQIGIFIHGFLKPLTGKA